MLPFIIATIDAFAIYLVLTAGSGDVLLWSPGELLMGFLLSIIVGIITRNYLCKSRNYRMLNPLRWLKFIAYGFGPFFIADWCPRHYSSSASQWHVIYPWVVDRLSEVKK